jgi:hypothetical protein
VADVVLAAVGRGHFDYFGVSGNFQRLLVFVHEVRHIWLKWLRRRNNRTRLYGARVTRSGIAADQAFASGATEDLRIHAYVLLDAPREECYSAARRRRLGGEAALGRDAGSHARGDLEEGEGDLGEAPRSLTALVNLISRECPTVVANP